MRGSKMLMIVTFVALVLVKSGACRSAWYDDSKDPSFGGGFGPVSKYYFRVSYALNGDECLDPCKKKGQDDFASCITRFDWKTFSMKSEQCKEHGTKIGDISHKIYSSSGAVCRDKCAIKGGFTYPDVATHPEYAWCVIDIDATTPSYPKYQWMYCSPDNGMTTATGLKCGGRCDWHCDCKNGKTSCGNCGIYQTNKWCYVPRNKYGINWDWC